MITPHSPRLQRISTAFLQFVVVLIGLGALAFLLVEPHLEGRNAHATVFEIYFTDLFLAYAYVASTAFFVALYYGFKVLGAVGRNQFFSPAVGKALRTIRWCAFALIGFVAIGELLLLTGESDDRAGGVFMGVLFTFGATTLAAGATALEQILQTALARPSGSDQPV